MTDPFDALGLPRRIWLDPETVQDHYRNRAASAHPDRPGGSAEALGSLNEARLILSSHSRRLKLLAESQTKEARRPFEPDWTLFNRIGSVERSARGWNQAFTTASTPLQKAVLAVQQKSLRKDLLETQNLLAAHVEDLVAVTREADQHWPEVPTGTLLTLAESWTYAERWSATLDEARALLDGA